MKKISLFSYLWVLFFYSYLAWSFQQTQEFSVQSDYQETDASEKKVVKRNAQTWKLESVPLHLHITLYNNNNPSCKQDLQALVPVSNQLIPPQTGYGVCPAALKEHYLHLGAALKNLWNRHKYTFLSLSFLSTWLGSGLFCLYAEYNMLHKLYWIHWNKHLSLEQLKAQNQKQLAQDLLLSIQQHYKPEQYVKDFFTPLVNFLHDLKNEIKCLNRFITLRTYIRSLHLERFFPQQAQALDYAKTLLARSEYLKEIFIQWIAQHKIDLNCAHA